MPPFMWSLEMIIGASIGGFLAEPASYYSSVFSPGRLFGKYPYLLPNLTAVGFIFIALVQGYFLLEETNLWFQSQSRGTGDSGDGPVNGFIPLQPSTQRN
jgi:hypothetical protein